ncbi:hypothetical protein KC343_g20090 [Hortaea werneckii]|nr:hypothetical protein KC343_g20090 [Hortaea werneckii]KAI7615241.1 hypothetical protein KC319_g19718 [Hortaea werneckii]
MTGRSSAKGPGIVGGEDYSACHWLMMSGKATCAGVVGEEDCRDWAVQKDPGEEGGGEDAIAAEIDEGSSESNEDAVAELTTSEFCRIFPPAVCDGYVFRKALGATATTTIKLATIRPHATRETRMMLPREAGNLPRIT